MATTGNLVYNRELFYQDITAPATKTSLSNRTLHAIIHVGKVVKNRRVYLFCFLGTNGLIFMQRQRLKDLVLWDAIVCQGLK